MMALFATSSGRLLFRHHSLVVYLFLASLFCVKAMPKINVNETTCKPLPIEKIVKKVKVGDDVVLPCGETEESKAAMQNRTVVLWRVPTTGTKGSGDRGDGDTGNTDEVIPIVSPVDKDGNKFGNSKHNNGRIVVNYTNSSVKFLNVSLSDPKNFYCKMYHLSTCLYVVHVQLVIVDRPGPPVNVTVEALSESQLRIFWMPGLDHFSPITQYKVKVSRKRAMRLLRRRKREFSSTSNTRIITVHHPKTETVVAHLEPYTVYQSLAQASNAIGASVWTSPVDQRTMEGEPTLTPVIVNTNTTNTTVTFSVHVSELGGSAMRGQFAGLDARLEQGKDVINETRVGKKTKKITFVGLRPNTLYKVFVRVRNNRHPGPWKSSEIRTEEGLPGPPRVFATTVVTSYTFMVRWEAPRVMNGVVISYVITVIEKETGQEQILGCPDVNKLSMKISNLRPYTEYLVYVAARTKAGTGPRDGPQKVLTDIGPPDNPKLVQVRINTTASGVAVDWNPPDKLLKPELTSYVVCWQERRDTRQACLHAQTTRPKQSAFLYIVPEPSDVIRKMPITYRMIIPWDKLSNLWKKMRRGKQGRNHLLFTVYGRTRGLYCPSDKTGTPSSINLSGVMNSRRPNINHHMMNSRHLLVMPIKERTSCYHVGEKSEFMKLVITDEDYRRLMSGSMYGGARGTSGDSSVIVLVIVLVLIIVFVAASVIFIVACRRCGSHRGYDLALNNGLERINSVPHILTCGNTTGLLEPDVMPSIVPYSECGIMPVESHAFPDHVALLHADSEVGFSQEFDEIDKKQAIKNWPDTVARLPENAQKNRYTNIFPYDHTRVRVQHMGGIKRSDYVNANFIDGYDHKNAYIAAQGPMPSTFEDFWQMIWEQRTNTIVMISNLIERGRLKCDQYWPLAFGQEGSQQYGRILVTLNRQVELAYYIYRELTVRNLKSKKCASKFRILYHYQYTDWPDFAVPDSPLPVLVFIKKTVSHIGKSAGPILVHCSAGVGRTGTYLCIESQIRQFEREKNFNVRGFLEHIRQQRMKLVQTEEQYAFIHDALLEHYLCPYHEIPRTELSSYVKLLKEVEPCSCVRLEREFQLCVSYRPQDWELTFSMKTVNENKSRSGIYPVFSREVALPAEPGVDGSNYINASYLQGYWRRDEFIVTQHPFEHTVTDFWKMVWDQNSSQVILLTGNMPNMEYPCFWPLNPDDTKEAGYLRVGFLQRRDYQHSTHLKFLVSSTREDYSLVSNMWLYKQWPTGMDGVMDLFHFIRHLQVEREKTGPFIVIDELGGSRAGIFCALNSLMDQLDNENCVDVYFVFKMYHRQRPGIFQCMADLEFIYDAIERYSREPPPALPPPHSSNSSPATLPAGNNAQENGGQLICTDSLTRGGRLTPNGVTFLNDPTTVSFYSNGGTLPRLVVRPPSVNNGCATLDSRASRDPSENGGDALS